MLCLAVMYFVGGSNYLAQRIAVTGFPPLRMVGIRFSVAGALLYAALRARGAAAPSARQWGAAALSAIPLISIGIGGIGIAVQRAPSGLAALVFGSVPLWTVLFDRLRGGRLARAEIGGLVLGLAGVALVSSRGALRAIRSPRGPRHGGREPRARVRAHTPAAIPSGPLGPATQMVSGGMFLLVASAAIGEHMATPTTASVLALGYDRLWLDPGVLRAGPPAPARQAGAGDEPRLRTTASRAGARRNARRRAGDARGSDRPRPRAERRRPPRAGRPGAAG